MNKELNVARVLKQLVYILEENDFVLYYDKRFESLKPQIDDERNYLYHQYLDNPYSPITYLSFRDSELNTDYHLDYRDTFTHTLHYSKYPYPMPQNPRSLKMETYLDPYKEYSEIEAKELAQEIFHELMEANKQQFEPNDVRLTKYRKSTIITKESLSKNRKSTIITKESLSKNKLETRIYKHLAPHYGTIFLDEPFYIIDSPFDDTKCKISIDSDLKIKIQVTVEIYPCQIQTKRNGVLIEVFALDDDEYTLTDDVGAKYSTEDTISSPNNVYETIQELINKIKSVQIQLSKNKGTSQNDII